MEKTPADNVRGSVRILKVQTFKALKERNGVTALEAMLVKMASLGYLATATIPVRSKQLPNGQLVTESFLLILSQIGTDIEDSAIDEIEKQSESGESEEPKSDEAESDDSDGIEDVSSNAPAVAHPESEPEIIIPES